MIFKFKKLFSLVLLVGLFFFTDFVLAQGRVYHIDFDLQKKDIREKIIEYKTKIKINKNSSVDIEEEINYDFGNRKRHGIFRKIPTKYKTTGGNNRSIRISKIKVLRDGHWDDVSITHEKGLVVIKIGKASKLLEGEHKYTIKYRVKGAINYFKDYSGLFPNTDFRQNPPVLPSACQKKFTNTPYLCTFFDSALNKTESRH